MCIRNSVVNEIDIAVAYTHGMNSWELYTFYFAFIDAGKHSSASEWVATLCHDTSINSQALWAINLQGFGILEFFSQSAYDILINIYDNQARSHQYVT